MKKNYLKPEIEVQAMHPQQLVAASTIDFKKKAEPEETEDDEVNDFGMLL